MKKILKTNQLIGTILSRNELKTIMGGLENPGDKEIKCFTSCGDEATAATRGYDFPGAYETAYAACLSACIGSGAPTMPDPQK